MLGTSVDNLNVGGPMAMSLGLVKGFLMSAIVGVDESKLRSSVEQVVVMLQKALSEESANAVSESSDTGTVVQPGLEHERHADTAINSGAITWSN